MQREIDKCLYCLKTRPVQLVLGSLAVGQPSCIDINHTPDK
jgi:hypothetical protein